MKILVTGAAGYIGSVVTEQLVEQGHLVLAVDNLKHGHRSAVHPAARFVEGDLLEGDWLMSFLKANPVEAVVHLAAEARIDTSMRDPGLFFRVNVSGGLHLLEAMVTANVKRIVFSSTAAVYGESINAPITEDARPVPVNPYGDSKLMFETILEWYRQAYGLNYIVLRYFNAAGASGRYGESHLPETHLIPIVMEVALGKRKAIQLYGSDYDTPDNTCIRDYVHVTDIAQAHVLALTQMDWVGPRHFNVGNSVGYSNRQVIEMVRQVTGRDIPVIQMDRRAGDPARLVANSERIRRELNWVPRHPDLRDIVETAWAWREAHPAGYEP
jgi:UDP-glucose 4-epimerase